MCLEDEGEGRERPMGLGSPDAQRLRTMGVRGVVI